MERIELDGTETAVLVGDEPTTAKRLHPFRGLFWGLLLGIGLAGVLIVTTTITVSLVSVIVVLVGGLFVGVVWGLVGPAKSPKGPPPTTRVLVEQASPTRFDDATHGTPTSTPAPPPPGPETARVETAEPETFDPPSPPETRAD